ncbi:hypothetical protein AB834_03140 [PVC group bacterium (ex Bugula neritina AB1)]|nr:hypothetical protein AB834_03140 [PVC group bacterium (ex Bugula neritina AB1)]
MKERNTFLFETKTGKPQNPRYIRKIITQWGKRALLKNISPHTLRHSFATNKIAQTGKIKAFSQYLGHSSSSVTLDMYTHQELSTTELFC